MLRFCIFYTHILALGAIFTGRCVCNEGYVSSDCSLDLATPPLLAGILDSGLCDEYDLPCDYAYVFGELFSDDDGLTCRLEEFNILPDGTREYGSSHYVLAELETLFEVRCPLSTIRQRREALNNDIFVSGFTISISNDGTNFGSGVDLFIYTSECQIVVMTEAQTSFSVMPGHCFLEEQCLANGFAHPTRNCTFCDTTQSQTSWSFVEDGVDCVLPRGDHNTDFNVGLVVGACMACVAVVVIAATIVIYIKWKTKERKKRVGTLPSDMYSFPTKTDNGSRVQFDSNMLQSLEMKKRVGTLPSDMYSFPTKTDNGSRVKFDSNMLQSLEMQKRVGTLPSDMYSFPTKTDNGSRVKFDSEHAI